MQAMSNMYCVYGHAGAEYTDQRKRKGKGRGKSSGKKASPSETMKYCDSAADGPLADLGAEPATQTSLLASGGAAAGDAEADASPTSTKVEKGKKKQHQKSQSDLTAPQLGLLHDVSLPACIPCGSKKEKSNKAAPSSCVTGFSPALDDVPTPGSDTEDDKLKSCTILNAAQLLAGCVW